MSGADLLARARQELDAADLLATGGFGAQAISRSYFAAFYAAEAALLGIGETRSKHAGVIAAFGQLVVRQAGFSADDGRLLRSLFERRNEADYAHAPVPTEEVTHAISDARRFVAAVEAWIADR
jgi:uncharacterized protein (UPF0332 family)